MAEATLLQQIKKDLLFCYICSAELKDPIGLPCLHGFCLECLETWHQDSQDKTQVICPDCKKPMPVPEEGIRGFPGHFLVQNLQETMDKKSTELLKNPTCVVCGKETEIHCVECNKDLCQACHTCHNVLMKDHQIVTIEEFHSGQVITEGRVCEVHGEQVRYYCETGEKQVCIDCVSLNTCQIHHKRVTIKEAARKQADLIDGLMKKCADNMKKFQDAIKDNKKIIGTLNNSVKQTKIIILNCKEQYKQQVDQVLDSEIEKVDKICKDRIKEVEDKNKGLESELGQMQEAQKQVCDLTALNSDCSITYRYSSLSKKLNELSLAEPVTADESLDYLAYEIIPMMVPSGYLMQRKRWTLTGQFPTSGMKNPTGIAINQDGDIAVTGFDKGVKVFSSGGQVQCSFMNDCTIITDVTVSHDNRYIVANGDGGKGLQFHTNEGKYLSCVPVTNTSNDKSNLNSVTVDINDQIIAALVQNTISVHYADGSLISKFATEISPYRLAATSEGEIVCTFLDQNCMELIEYSGSNVRVIQPPPEVTKWVPTCVCCGPGEIFVVNSGSGDPLGIFRYTSKGQYLGCVTTEVQAPRGIALSQDGMEISVVDRGDCQVKIFHRE